MKLAFSAASPYVRKVTACAIKRGINDKVERMKIGTTDPALLPLNPLSKVPTLVLDDGTSLYDSPVICEYLDALGEGPRLLPAEGEARWQALRLQALADGVLDAAFSVVMELRRPESERSADWIGRWRTAISRAVLAAATIRLASRNAL